MEIRKERGTWRELEGRQEVHTVGGTRKEGTSSMYLGQGLEQVGGLHAGMRERYLWWDKE